MVHHKVHHASHPTHHTNHTHHKRGFMKHLMENKALVTAIIVVFVLVIAVGGYMFFGGEGEEGKSDVAEQCSFLCETGQRNAYCNEDIAVTETFRAKCRILAEDSLYEKYGVEVCSTISCALTEEELDETCEGIGGVWD
ncbi:MAG: hypothetical protein Q8P81_00030, partial [Nanoarchaeota archaeon]|nr:hypothetical protein [Nanoarchaeota archaeon]